MNKAIAQIQAFILSRDGATAIEYGLFLGGISLAIVTVVFTVGVDLKSVFGVTDIYMQTAIGNK